MKALTYTASGRFELIEKPKPEILDPMDAVVRVTLSSICSSDLHILHLFSTMEKIILGIDPGTNIMGYGLIKVVDNKAQMLTIKANPQVLR